MTTYDTVTWRKARRSGGNGGNCVEVGVWKKAARSGGNGGNCVEVKAEGPFVLIRDSKYLRDPSNAVEMQPIIAITAAQWREFLDVVAGRSAAASEPVFTVHADGAATLETADLTLEYTRDEWEAFALGVIEGEFDDLTSEREAAPVG